MLIKFKNITFSKGRGYQGRRFIFWPKFGQISLRIGKWWYGVSWVLTCRKGEDMKIDANYYHKLVETESGSKKLKEELLKLLQVVYDMGLTIKASEMKAAESGQVEHVVVPLADIEAIEQARLLLCERFDDKKNRIDSLMKLTGITGPMWKLTHQKYPAP